jgi:hypothetical protein
MRRARFLGRHGWLYVLVLLLGALSGCARVRAYEREYLADRIMDYERDSREERVARKWLEAREGSTGGGEGAGGGCACN